MEVVVPGKDGDLGVPLHQAPEDVGLGSVVHDGDVDVSVGVEDVGLLGRDLSDEVLARRVPVLAVGGRSLGDLLLSDGDSTEGRSLVSEERCDGPRVDARHSGNAVSVTPLVQTLDSEVVRVLERDVGDDDSSALDAARLHLRDTGELGGGLVGGDTIITD